MADLDPVTLAVIRGRLEQIADEMDATLFRTAFNPIIAEGHDALLAGAESRRAKGLSGPGANTRHVVTTSSIEIDGDVATGRSVFHFYADIDTAAPTLVALGVYADRFERTGEGWKLAERLLRGNAEDRVTRRQADQDGSSRTAGE